MTIDAAFDEELAQIDGTKSFSVTINGAWGENEYQIDGYDITAGSNEAAELGAVEALYELGYRFWTPYWITRPSSLPSGGVTIARTTRSLSYCNMFTNYGFNNNTYLSEFDRFCTLNGCNDSRRPLAHAWGSWYLSDTAWFQANPNVYTLAGSRPVFALSNATHFETLAQRAALWLSTRLNSYNRYGWDPPDGDNLPSEQVWPWIARCVQILRTTYGIADAELGAYVYGGHREFQPIIDGGYDLTGCYAQVALGFNDLGIGYPALVDGWGGIADVVMLRGYGDISAQDEYIIPSDADRNINFLGSYPSFIASGALGCNFETSANWIKNVVSHYTLMRVWAQGGNPSDEYDNTLSELVTNIFEGDSAVSDLFLLWDAQRYSGNEIVKRSFDIVDTMQADSWWKDRFGQFLAVQVGLLNPVDDYATPGYFTQLEEVCRWCAGLMAEDGSVHMYAIARQKLGSGAALSNDREDVYVDANPHWRRYPALPSAADIAAAKTLVIEDVGYPDVAEPPLGVADWVEVSLPAPTGLAASVPGTDAQDSSTKIIETRSNVDFIFVGPGTVTVRNTSNEVVTSEVTYGDGLHRFSIDGDKDTLWDTGTLYAIASPTMFKDQISNGLWWAYLPLKLQGWHKIESSIRLSIYDANGRHDFDDRDLPPVGFIGQDLVPGTVCVFNQTRGSFSLRGACPTISPTRDKILMPRALARLEGLTPI